MNMDCDVVGVALNVLRRYLGNVWVVKMFDKLVSIEVKDEAISTFLVDGCLVTRDRGFMLCGFYKKFSYSIRKFLELAELWELRVLEKSIPEKVKGIDLCERVVKFLSLDVNWKKGKRCSAIRDLVEALEVFSAILSDEAISVGATYCYIGWISDFCKLPYILRLYGVKGLFSTSLLYGRDGCPVLLTGTYTRRFEEKDLETSLKLLIRVVLKCASHRLRWVLFGTVRVSVEDLMKQLRLKNLS